MSEQRLLWFGYADEFQGAVGAKKAGAIRAAASANGQLGLPCHDLAAVRSLIERLRAELGAAEADAIKHFGSN